MRSKQSYAYREGWLAIATNIILFGLKYWAGIVTGSIAIIADAWHTLSDSLTSLVLLIGTRISNKPADHEHPFGHGRAEWISSLIIGVLLAVIAFNFIVESVDRLISHEEVVYGKLAIIVTVISILGKEGMAQYAFWAYKKSGSKSVRADAWHHRTDAISSLIILVGIFLGRYFWWIDGALGLAVAGMLIYATYDILRDTTHIILGEKPDDPMISQIKQVCSDEVSIDVYPHQFHVHNYGDHTEMTLHIKLPPGMTLHESHEIASRIERSIWNKMEISATIHMEPYGKG
ncbi:MAG: cation diffusion facilitator family transporter [Bacteroidales bacterium]|nr:cation diffusion facilitator family transporter [Bacteroidales bacterium]